MEELDKIIGSEIELSYYDHNEVFSKELPKTGRILSRHQTNSVDDWYLVALTSPINYQGKFHQELLIRSKWQGQQISSAEKTGVFILLIPDHAALRKNPLDIQEFDHVAWGFAIVNNI